MKYFEKTALLIIVTLFIACNKDNEIRRLLNGPRSVDRIEGCYEAAETSDIRYLPLLLKNANIPLITSNIRFKGISVYQADMYSLSKLLGVSPPHPITRVVDTTNVDFFIKYWDKKSHSERI
jgi:hypothetical protein